jgi:AcrR family transcriptional regulator
MSNTIERESRESATPISSRQRIVETARRLLIDEGYLGVSRQHIADATGLRKASLYHHFPSKEALFAKVMVLEMDRLLAEFAQADLVSGTIEERLRRLAAINYQRLDQPEVHQLIVEFFRYVPETEHDEVHERLHEMETILAGIFASAIAAGELAPIEPIYAATMFFHMMMALAHDPNEYRQITLPPPEEAAALVARVFVHGLGRS